MTAAGRPLATAAEALAVVRPALVDLARRRRQDAALRARLDGVMRRRLCSDCGGSLRAVALRADGALVSRVCTSCEGGTVAAADPPQSRPLGTPCPSCGGTIAHGALCDRRPRGLCVGETCDECGERYVCRPGCPRLAEIGLGSEGPGDEEDEEDEEDEDEDVCPECGGLGYTLRGDQEHPCLTCREREGEAIGEYLADVEDAR